MSTEVGTCVRSSAVISHTLVVQYRTQHAPYFYEIPLRTKDGFDVLVCGRSFVAQPFGETVVVPDAIHLAPQLAFSHSCPRGSSTQRAASTMRAGAEGRFVPSAFNVEARVAHRPGQHSRLPESRWHGALAMYPKVASCVTFQRHMVVVGRDGRLPAQPRIENPFHYC